MSAILQLLLADAAAHEHAVVFGLLAALVALLVVRTLHRWNADPNNPVRLTDLILENGRVSRGAVVMMGAFAATTWFFVYYALIGKMTEGYFGLYSAAWIAPVVARMLSGAPAAAPLPAPAPEPPK